MGAGILVGKNREKTQGGILPFPLNRNSDEHNGINNASHVQHIFLNVS